MHHKKIPSDNHIHAQSLQNQPSQDLFLTLNEYQPSKTINNNNNSNKNDNKNDTNTNINNTKSQGSSQ